MPAPTGDDHPATRRELQRSEEVVVSTLTARLAELRAEIIDRITAAVGELRTEMNSRLDAMNSRLDKMNDRFVAMNSRLDKMNDRFVAQERRISNQTRVLLLAMAAMWGTLLAAMYRLS